MKSLCASSDQYQKGGDILGDILLCYVADLVPNDYIYKMCNIGGKTSSVWYSTPIF